MTVKAESTAAGGNLMFWDMQREYPIIERGEGIYLWDKDGRRYIDGAGGSSVVNSIGHGREEVARAMYEQARKVALAPPHVMANEAALELGRLVADMTPGDLNKVFLLSGGSEATENCMKLARQYQVERGEAGRHLVVCRWQGFHGNTFGALSVTGHTLRRSKYIPMLTHHPHIAPAHCYRCALGQTYPSCELACAHELERIIRLIGEEHIAAFIAEPVVGATLAASPAPPGYFQVIREICDRYGLLLIADEVMTGFGRTGRNFGMEHWDTVPDIMAVAKSIASGYVPLGGVVARDYLIDQFTEAGASFVAGHTYGAHPVTAAAGVAVQHIIRAEKLVQRCAERGKYFLDGLTKLLDHPLVGDVRGLGLMAGVEFVADRKTKKPYPQEAAVANRVTAACFERGLIVYPGNGTADGRLGDHLLLAPTFTVTEEELDEYLGLLEEGIAAVEEELGLG